MIKGGFLSVSVSSFFRNPRLYKFPLSLVNYLCSFNLFLFSFLFLSRSLYKTLTTQLEISRRERRPNSNQREGPISEMELVSPSPATDFNFDSSCSSPYMTAPSSPKRFGTFYHFSAPTSPSRVAAIFREFRIETERYDSGVPFDWEEKPGTPRFSKTNRARDEEEEEDDFAFDFSGQLESPCQKAAEELFEEGKIRPLKPPPRLLADDFGPISPKFSRPKSPRSPRRVFAEAVSPRGRKETDPFKAAMEETRTGPERMKTKDPISARRAARSVSPFRVSDTRWDESVEPDNPGSKPGSIPSPSPPRSSSKKWRLKNFLLFRSSSEGRATAGKDPLRKYAVLSKIRSDELKSSSFRSTDSSGSVSGSMRRGRVSAHELHYATNRAVSEEMKKKTFLPYRQGLLGCLGFCPTPHELAKGFHSIRRD